MSVSFSIEARNSAARNIHILPGLSALEEQQDMFSANIQSRQPFSRLSQNANPKNALIKLHRALHIFYVQRRLQYTLNAQHLFGVPVTSFCSSLARFLLPCAFITDRDHSLRVCFVFDEVEFALWESAREKGNAFADERWQNAQVNFVDQIFLQKIANQYSPAHQPDVFAGLLAKFGDNGAGRFAREGNVIAFAGRQRSGEYKIFY